MLPRRRRAQRRIVFAAMLALAIVVIEIGARIWLLLNTPEPIYTYRQHAAAYRDSTYFGAAFRAEQMAWGASQHFDESGLTVSTFHGQYFNHDGRIRRTVGQPAHASHTLYMIGTSTTLNGEVPDEYTIASYLQTQLTDYKVVNLGTSGTNARQQIVILKEQPLTTGDLVVFYGGIGDASGNLPRYPTFPQRICESLQNVQVGIIEAVCTLAGNAAVGTPSIDADQIANNYRARLQEAANWCARHGALFFTFLQPVLSSESLQSDEERYVWSNPKITPIEVRLTLPLGWPVLQTVTRQFPNGYDLTHILDAERHHYDIYLDFDHTTERGNQIVAAAIADHVAGAF